MLGLLTSLFPLCLSFSFLLNKIIDYIIAFYMYYMDIDPGEEQYSTFQNAKTKK